MQRSRNQSPAKTEKPMKKSAKSAKSERSASPRKATPAKAKIQKQAVKQTSSRPGTASRSKSKASPKKTPASKGKAKPIAKKTLKKVAPKKDVKSKSVDQAVVDSESDESGDSTVVYKKDAYIAFIDVNKENDQRFEKFTVGKMVQDMKDDDTTGEVKAHQAGSQTKTQATYTTGRTVTISDWQILGPIEVNATAKGCTLKTKIQNQMNKIFDNNIDAVKERVGDDSEDSDASEEESEEESPAKKKKVAQPISSRKILKPKRKLTQPQASGSKVKSPSASKRQKTEEKSNKSGSKGKALSRNNSKSKALSRNNSKSKALSKKPSKQIKAAADEDMESDEESQIDTMIGKKRLHPLNESQSVPPNRRAKKQADGSEKIIVEPAKPPSKSVAKVVAKPVIFKLGKWNPDTVLVNEEKEKYGKTSEPDYGTGHRNNARNVIRAVNTDNLALLRKCQKDTQKVFCLNKSWAEDYEGGFTPLQLVALKESTEMLEVFYPNFPAKKGVLAAQNQYSTQINELYNLRKEPRDPLLHKVNTGYVSNKAYGVRIRQVEMSRGNRQGNQAFMNQAIRTGLPSLFADELTITKKVLRDMSIDFFKAYKLCRDRCGGFGEEGQVRQLLLCGNRKLAAWKLEPLIKHENYGYNQMHLDVLKLNKLTEKYHTASLTKKAHSDSNVTPMHFACLNPNVEVLAKMLDQAPEFNVQDAFLFKPIHFAAACEDSGPLELLLSKGASAFDISNTKQSALHIAAQVGRAKNITVLLNANRAIWKLRDRQNKNGMAYALELGEIEPIKAFLDSGVVKINGGQGKDRMSPLSYAAAQGNYELCEFLLERKARVLSKDKFKRTPLIMAVRNGHVKVASLLLQYGSDWNHPDSSFNTPLHYAAGFGWKECVNLLLDHGANVNANNSWKVTPITIAMLKDNIGIVFDLLKRQDVEVNGKDDQGRTLLMLSMVDLTDPFAIDFSKHLLEKGANVNSSDVNGRTCLHALATYTSQAKQKVVNGQMVNDPETVEIELNNLKGMIKLLIDKGISIDAVDEDKKTAFERALEQNAVNILPLLTANVSLNRTPMLLHRFTKKIFDDRYRSILKGLIEAEPISKEVINCLDEKGFTPFLTFVKAFVDERSFLYQKISTLISYQEFKHKSKVDMYKINNIDLFEFVEPTTEEYRVWQNTRYNPGSKVFQLDTDRRKAMQTQCEQELIVEPLITFLKFLVTKDADKSAKVEKLEFYRKLDKHKQHIQLVDDEREGLKVLTDAIMKDEGPQMIDTTDHRSAQMDSNTSIRVKKRNMAIAEQNYENKIKKKGKKNKAGPASDAKDARKAIHGKIKEFYAQQGFSPEYQSINGKKVEIEYDKEHGQQNAVHLLMRHPDFKIYKYLLNEKVQFDDMDFKKRNPFTIGVDFSMIPRAENVMGEEMKDLIKSGVNFDLPDDSGQTPYLKLYNARLLVAAEFLRSKGANIKAMSKAGVFVLKIALIRREDAEIKRLVDLGADINQIDPKGRNLLHFAINMSSATADATFEIEQQLIDLGVDINKRDYVGRVPLHYAFVKIKLWSDSHQIDPIETISSLCAQRHLEIDVPDKWQKTPLHYAAQRSSTISTLYILQRGAELSKKDIYGNTPLGIALDRGHFNYGIILIQKNADVKVPVYKEFPRRLAKQWKDEEEKNQKDQQQKQDVEMDNEDEGKNSKSHRNLFQPKKGISMNLFRFLSDSDSDDGDESDDSASSHGSKMEMNLLANQNPFGNQFGGGHSFGFPQKKRAFAYAPFGQPEPEEVAKPDVSIEKENPPRSTFRIAIQGSQQGIAYLILDNGYDYMLAMQDALDETKFQLFLTLISKTADDNIVRQKNDKGQNLFHILAKNSNNSQNHQHIISRIYKTLKQRGVDCLENDSLGNNALHFAVKCKATELVRMLIYDNIKVNTINSDGDSPLSIALKGKDPPTLREYVNEQGVDKNIYQLLIMSGANVNIVYPEDSHKKKPLKNEKKDVVDKEKDYKCSLLINYMRHNHLSLENMVCTMSYLMSHGATFDILDSESLSVLIYALKHNSEELIQFLLDSKDTHKLDLNFKDARGWTVMHYCVQPLDFGSYENTTLLGKLHNAGFKYNGTDKEGKTPLDLALSQDSQTMAKKLCQMDRISFDDTLRQYHRTTVTEIIYPEPSFNFTDDAQLLIAEAEEKRAKEVFEKGEGELDYVPLDQTIKGDKQYKVYYDSEKRPWDAYMTKVDLKNGPYGDYVFYKLQMVHDTNRDLYVVLTRYGRIGETGMNQRTPFNEIDEAKKEFSTIFKQKTGNEWETARDEFEDKPKKYSLVEVLYTNVKHEDYLAPIDYDNCAISKEPMDKKIENLIELISSVTMYQRAVSQMQIDVDLLPISGLKKGTIEKAKTILCALRPEIDKLDKLRSQHMKADFDEVAKVKGVISKISSEFFQLIPKTEHKDEITRPIMHLNQLKSYFEFIDKLTNIEYSSRLLLGALYRQYQFNPTQYIYESLGVRIQALQKGDAECDLVRAYAMNTYEQLQSHWGNNQEMAKKIRIFKIDRQGDDESFNEMKDLGNRKLLWHGSAMSNFLGILSQGLRIAPPEAPSTGYMFGKGVYFADLISKSLQYSVGYKSNLLILCEVALGNQLELYRQEDVTTATLGTQYHSVKGMGARGPDFKKLVYAPQGYGIPIGKSIAYPNVPQKTQEAANAAYTKRTGQQVFGNFGMFGRPNNGYQLQHNEYIVYNTAQIKMRYLVQLET